MEAAEEMPEVAERGRPEVLQLRLLTPRRVRQRRLRVRPLALRLGNRDVVRLPPPRVPALALVRRARVLARPQRVRVAALAAAVDVAAVDVRLSSRVPRRAVVVEAAVADAVVVAAVRTRPRLKRSRRSVASSTTCA